MPTGRTISKVGQLKAKPHLASTELRLATAKLKCEVEQYFQIQYEAQREA